jgi:hypothetical protein
VTLPSEPKLAAVSSRVIFTKACSLALSESRIPSDLAANLIEQAKELLVASQSLSSTAEGERSASPLSDALGAEITTATGQLQALLDDAAAVTGELDLSADAMVDLSALEKLRALRIVTPEEELLQFIQVRCLFTYVASAGAQPVCRRNPHSPHLCICVTAMFTVGKRADVPPTKHNRTLTVCKRRQSRCARPSLSRTTLRRFRRSQPSARGYHSARYRSWATASKSFPRTR